MDNRPAPVFRELHRHEIDALLGRNNVGRIAFTFHDRVDIEPINYVYSWGWLYGRTSKGAKLDTIAHNRWVAFEVDEVKGLFDWQSVVVKGSFEIVGAETWTHHDPGFIRGLDPDAESEVVFAGYAEYQAHPGDGVGRRRYGCWG
jgi:nitroimidazol reductase NimA-like FMN-containing flavoprotein (pyridoxamine 5'-phosphate oxidase superfamily)